MRRKGEWYVGHRFKQWERVRRALRHEQAGWLQQHRTYKGTLCGPAPNPCALLANEELPSMPGRRVDAPSIALDDTCSPHVLYASQVVGGSQGQERYAWRDATKGWLVENFPMPEAQGSLVFASKGVAQALVDDGAGGVTLWSRHGAWSMIDAVPGNMTVGAGALGVDPAGALYAGFMDSNAHTLVVGVHNGLWATTPGDGQVYSAPRLSLSAVASPHLTYWRLGGLFWVNPPNTSENFDTSKSVPACMPMIAVGAPDATNPGGKPHVLYCRSVPYGLGGSLDGIAYATRTSALQWSVTQISSDSPNRNPCVGQTCTFDYTTTQPLGLAVSQGGDVRVIYSAIRHQGQQVFASSSGTQSPDLPTGTITNEIRIAWIDAGGTVQVHALGAMPSSPIAFDGAGPTLSSATPAIDSIGRIHIALYVLDPPNMTDDASVRYVLIGPAGP